MHNFQFPPTDPGERRSSLTSSPAPAGDACVPEQKRARVLVMDDEISILELITRMLGSQGYEVKAAFNGAAAITEYRNAMEAGERFDVVILDLTVPHGMGGIEAFKAIQAIDPSVRAIVSSGYSHEPEVVNYKQHGIAGVAPKPYRVAELVRVVESALAR